jgi:acyl dehydratase
MPPLPLTTGQTATRSLTLTERHVELYAEITGDHNPLHFDPEFVAHTKFGRLVVQGGLTTGVLHALVATDMPGPGTVFLSQNWKFTAPVFIGDTITAEAEVLSVHASKPVCQLGVRIRRQDGVSVLEGEAWCYQFDAAGIQSRVRRVAAPAPHGPGAVNVIDSVNVGPDEDVEWIWTTTREGGEFVSGYRVVRQGERE